MKPINCPALVRAFSRTLTIPGSSPTQVPSAFTFAVLADPQLGLLEYYVEKRPLPHHWDRELQKLNKSIALLNRLSPKPTFVVACGDLVNAVVGDPYREPQTADLLNAFSNLDPSIGLVTLPGNHDVGDSPTMDTIQEHTAIWGDDYYSFRVNHVEFLVLNSQYLWDDSKCEPASINFKKWFDDQLVHLKNKPGVVPIVLQHIPFFEREPNEPDDYFNIPTKNRFEFMSRLYAVGVRHVFAGHLHHNSVLTWLPPEPVPVNATQKATPLNMISTSSVCVPLGTDPPGFRLVHVGVDGSVQHAYWTLDELEALLNRGEQPKFI